MRKALGLLLLMVGWAVPVLGAEWRVEPERSTIAVTVTQNGRPLEARFTRFDAAVSFDPAKPEAARIRITVDTASFASGIGQVDQAAVSREFLASSEHPQAVYETQGVRPLGGDRYEITASLALRGVALPVTHLATIQIRGEEARATGEIALMRTQWGIGRSQFPTGEQVGLEVTVRFDLVAVWVSG